VRTSSRNVAILLFEEVELWDVSAMMHVTSAAGRNWNWRPFRLYPTAVVPGLVATRSQLRLEASVSLAECPSPEILFVPGGYGARRAAADLEVTAWCARAAAEAQLLVAIGAGVAVLGKAGLLDGQEIAAAKDSQEWLARELPQTTLNAQDGLVTSGRLLTAASSSHGIDLGLLVVERALGARVATALRGTLGHPLPPDRLELPANIEIPLVPRR
jgi:transcriptional regulator GlxA family with amidase domain